LRINLEHTFWNTSRAISSP